MWNRFRLWVNKNDIKIITVILIIIGIFILIKGVNSFFKGKQQEKKNNYEIENISIFDDVQYSEEDFTEINNSSDEYKTLNKIAEKIIDTIYKARKDDDYEQKQNLINMCSNRFINNLTTPKRTITTDNILLYVDEVKDVNDYSIKNIYKYGEKDNIAKYIISKRLDAGGAAIIDSYMVINIDKNNKTFSYDGDSLNLNTIYNGDEQFETIENKGSNTF